MKAFISYARRDQAMLERLHIHLAMLRREGGITEWYDRDILAGGSIDREIASQLDTSRLFLALVSPDFLNSQYCYESEMQRAIEKHAAGEVTIVPIILEPCDWLVSPLKQFKAVPRDGKPVSDWVNQNTAFLDVVTELRRVTQSISSSPEAEQTPTHNKTVKSPNLSTSKYRVKKSFDEIDRADFRRDAYEFIKDFFEKSAKEIDGVEGLRGRYRQIDGYGFTCSVVNQMIKAGRGGAAHITVRSNSRAGLGDIYYSFSENAPDNTANGSFRVESDDYQLFLRTEFTTRVPQNRTWSPAEAAQRLWEEFLQQAGISYD